MPPVESSTPVSDLERLRIDRGPRQRGRRRGWGATMAWGLVLVLAAGAAWLFRAPLLAEIDRARLPTVDTFVVRAEDPLAAAAMSGTSANGYVVAKSRAALSADTPGRIVEMNVEEGSVVREGDVVARLYSEEYEAAAEQAAAELDLARRSVERHRAEIETARAALAVLQAGIVEAEARVSDATAELSLSERLLERRRDLVERGVESEETLDELEVRVERSRASLAVVRAGEQGARATVTRGEREVASAEAALAEGAARVEAARAAHELALATLAKTEVRAPFDGVVVLKDAEVGEVVSPNAMGSSSRGSVVTMVDFASLEVQVEVPETSLSAVRIGEPATIFLDAWSTDPYAGRVDRVWPTANRQKATVEVRVSFEELDERLRPEMGVRVVFAAAPRRPAPDGKASAALRVPDGAVVERAGATGVFVVEEGVARWRAVALGTSELGRVAVERGLAEGERVVVEPPAELEDGERVLIQEET